jgi:hypothetical protein
MTGKSKLILAAITAVSLASPALAQTTTENGWGNTHQDRSLGSQSEYNYDWGSAAARGNSH